MATVHVHQLRKEFRVHRKAPGLRASFRSLFRRDWEVKTALAGLDLEVESGEIVGLLGANGAGKTTLVKMLTGILHPTSGDARVLDHVPWKRHDEFRRRIALIMGQKAQLWWDLPAADCFLLLREIYRVPPARFAANLAQLTEVFEVGHLLDIQIRRLSLGERMKMELIAALLHEPQVVFLDEPTIGLDLGAQRAIREFVLAYQREREPATILTSHYMEDIESLCERIVVLREGELVYDGSLTRLQRDYARHKVLTVHLQEPWAGALPGRLDDAAIEVLEREGETLKLRVPRAEVAAVASTLLREMDVVDLSIEEPEVGLVVAALQEGRV